MINGFFGALDALPSARHLAGVPWVLQAGGGDARNMILRCAALAWVVSRTDGGSCREAKPGVERRSCGPSLKLLMFSTLR